MPTSNFQPIRLLHAGSWYKVTFLMSKSVDPNQLPSSEAKTDLYLHCLQSISGFSRTRVNERMGANTFKSSPALRRKTDTFRTVISLGGLSIHLKWTFKSKADFVLIHPHTVFTLNNQTSYIVPDKMLFFFFQWNMLVFFFFFSTKHILWVLIRSASVRRF